MEFRAVKGMHDILPDEVARWQRLEAAFRAHVELHGYREVRTPLLEPTALFVRQIGETSDVVEKEMYSFERHGDALTVRPEGTASAARAYVEHSLHAREPVSKWYYIGPMFRGERPAKGRYRQFHQAGIELFGDPGPLGDAEMIELVSSFLASLGIPTRVHLNSLGSGDTHARFRDQLQAYLAPRRGELSEDSQRRLEKNPLRILDSKDPKDQEVARGAPSILDVLDDADRAHFDGLRRYLDALGVEYVLDPALVRGLDYYTRTLFELKAKSGDLGAQNTVVGGGRYDGMIESLGGPRVPAIGFAMGLERILLLMADEPVTRGPACYLAPIGDKPAAAALVLARDLRRLGVHVEVDGRGGKIGRMIGRADNLGARLCVILGDNELAQGVVTVKDLAAKVQDQIPLEGAARVLADRVAPSSVGPGDRHGDKGA